MSKIRFEGGSIIFEGDWTMEQLSDTEFRFTAGARKSPRKTRRAPDVADAAQKPLRGKGRRKVQDTVQPPAPAPVRKGRRGKTAPPPSRPPTS